MIYKGNIKHFVVASYFCYFILPTEQSVSKTAAHMSAALMTMTVIHIANNLPPLKQMFRIKVEWGRT